MLARQDILKLIDDAYAARTRGDTDRLAELWAPNAVYQLTGSADLLSRLPLGPTGAKPAVETLISLFQFHERSLIEAVVEGSTAALRWELGISAPGGRKRKTEMFDFWTISDDGKFQSLRQSTDTGMLAELLAEGAA